MTNGSFGPVSLDRPHQFEGRKKMLESTVNKAQAMGTTFLSNSKGFYGDETFTIRVTYQVAWDIMGLVESDEFLYIDTNPDIPLTQLPVRGYYKVNKVEVVKLINNQRCDLEVNATLISNNPNRPITIDYSKIYGVQLQHTFDMTTQFNKYRDVGETLEYPDPFDTYDTTNTWESYEQYGSPSTPNVYSSSGALVMECKASVDGSWAGVFTTARRSQNPPFVVETMTDPMTNLSSGDRQYEGWFYISPIKQVGTLWTSPLVRVGIVVKYNQWILYAQKRVGSTWTTLKSEAISNPSTDYPKWRIYVWSNNTISIYVDKGSGYYRFWGTGNPGFNFTELYFSYAFATVESRLLQQMRVPNLACYYNSGINLPYIVSGPVGATYNSTPTGYRVGSEGNIPVWKNPTFPIRFTTDPDDIYDGCVKAYRYTGTSYVQIWNVDEVLEPGDLKVSNGLYELIFDETDIKFKYYNSGFQSLNALVPDNYDYLEMLEWTGNRVIVQADSSFFFMWRGKPFFAVYHPDNGFGFTYKAYQYFDDGTGYDEYNLSSGADIDIEGAFACNVYGTSGGDSFGLSFIKQYPTTIQTNYLPPDSITGIGFYNNSKTLGNMDHWLSLASEFMTHTQQPFMIVRP